MKCLIYEAKYTIDDPQRPESVAEYQLFSGKGQKFASGTGRNNAVLCSSAIP